MFCCLNLTLILNDYFENIEHLFYQNKLLSSQYIMQSIHPSNSINSLFFIYFFLFLKFEDKHNACIQ